MASTHVGVPLLLVGLLTGCSATGSDPAPSPSPSPPFLPRAHSHNDYASERPLLDAVERGFASVEVDVVLLDGELYVAHELEAIEPSRTLTRLYLDPLRELARRRGGWIYAPSDPPLQLLIDVKSPADATYRALDETLAAYADILTTWARGGSTRGPVTAVLSGNRAIPLALADTLRYVALDGRIEEDRRSLSTEIMPLISVDWATIGPSDPAGELARARSLVDIVHEEGRMIRFWGTPDNEEIWLSLLEIGVDYVGTDDSGRLERALRAW